MITFGGILLYPKMDIIGHDRTLNLRIILPNYRIYILMSPKWPLLLCFLSTREVLTKPEKWFGFIWKWHQKMVIFSHFMSYSPKMTKNSPKTLFFTTFGLFLEVPLTLLGVPYQYDIRMTSLPYLRHESHGVYRSQNVPKQSFWGILGVLGFLYYI